MRTSQIFREHFVKITYPFDKFKFNPFFQFAVHDTRLVNQFSLEEKCLKT